MDERVDPERVIRDAKRRPASDRAAELLRYQYMLVFAKQLAPASRGREPRKQ